MIILLVALQIIKLLMKTAGDFIQKSFLEIKKKGALLKLKISLKSHEKGVKSGRNSLKRGSFYDAGTVMRYAFFGRFAPLGSKSKSCAGSKSQSLR